MITAQNDYNNTFYLNVSSIIIKKSKWILIVFHDFLFLLFIIRTICFFYILFILFDMINYY